MGLAIYLLSKIFKRPGLLYESDRLKQLFMLFMFLVMVALHIFLHILFHGDEISFAL